MLRVHLQLLLLLELEHLNLSQVMRVQLLNLLLCGQLGCLLLLHLCLSLKGLQCLHKLGLLHPRHLMSLGERHLSRLQLLLESELFGLEQMMHLLRLVLQLLFNLSSSLLRLRHLGSVHHLLLLSVLLLKLQTRLEHGL